MELFKKRALEDLVIDVRIGDVTTPFRVCMEDGEGVWRLSREELDSVISALTQARDQADRLNAAVKAALIDPRADPTPVDPVQEADLHLDVVRHNPSGETRVVAAGVQMGGPGWSKVGSVSAADWSRPEVRGAYFKYGRHIGGHVVWADGTVDNDTIVGFRTGWAQHRSAVIVQYRWGGWDPLDVLDRYEVRMDAGGSNG